MAARKTDFDYSTLKKVTETVAGVFNRDERRPMNVQYRCCGDETASPVTELCHGNVTEMLYECTEKLRPELPDLKEEELSYLIIPTLTHLMCGWCPKRHGNYGSDAQHTKLLRMTECSSAVSRLVELEMSTNRSDDEVPQKEYYELFWALETGKRAENAKGIRPRPKIS